MDWSHVRFDWNRARAFLVTAEEGSLSAAARALGMTQPTLGRQVTALEEELGVALFERVGRGLALTPNGAGLLEHVRTMGEAANRMAFAASGQSQAVEGRVTLTASEVVAAFLLPPVLARLGDEHPGLEIHLSASMAVRDLRRREADIAVRSGQPSDPELLATRLRDTPARLYATPRYLASIGNPRTPADLARARFIGFSDASYRFIDGMRALGFPLEQHSVRLLTTDHLVLWELVKRGLGVGVILEEVGDAEPLVTRVLPAHPPMPVPMWLVAHRELRKSRRVRLVFDALVDELGPRKDRPRSAKRGR